MHNREWRKASPRWTHCSHGCFSSRWLDQRDNGPNAMYHFVWNNDTLPRCRFARLIRKINEKHPFDNVKNSYSLSCLALGLYCLWAGKDLCERPEIQAKREHMKEVVY